MKVSELIRSKGRQVHTIEHLRSIAEAARVFLTHEISSLLVTEDGRVTGIFTKNDLIRRAIEHPGGFMELKVSDGMTTDLFTTTPDAYLEDVFREMLERSIRHVPVMDEGQPAGVVTSIDILMYQKNAMCFENEQLTRYIHGIH